MKTISQKGFNLPSLFRRCLLFLFVSSVLFVANACQRPDAKLRRLSESKQNSVNYPDGRLTANNAGQVKNLDTGMDSFFPSVASQKLHRELSLANELKLTIVQLPGVVTAGVHVRLKDNSVFIKDKTPKTVVSVVVKTDGELQAGDAVQTGGKVQLDGEQKGLTVLIKTIVSKAMGGMPLEDVSVFQVKTLVSQQKNTVFIGPVEVVESSSRSAKMLISVLLLVCLLLAIGLIYAGVKIRKLRRQF